MEFYINEMYITLPWRTGYKTEKEVEAALTGTIKLLKHGYKNPEEFRATINDEIVYFYRIKEEKIGDELIQYYFGDLPENRIKADGLIEIYFYKPILGVDKYFLPIVPSKIFAGLDIPEPKENQMLVSERVMPYYWFTINAYLTDRTHR